MELIIDVSASAATAGIAYGGKVAWSGALVTTRDHTTMLLPQILAGFSEISARPEDISLVVVAIGPGPFNGLRVAVSIAKGIAVAGGIPIVGVDSLLAEVCRHQAREGYLRPIMPAGKTTLATGLFMKSGTSWESAEDAQVVSEQALIEILQQGPSPLCGDIDEGLKARVRQQTTGEFAEPQLTRIQSLAIIGHERAATGATDPVATLQPLYARPPHITKPRERRQ